MNLSIRTVSALSQIGQQAINEDFIYPIQNESDAALYPRVNNLYIVCDGIGGANKGDVAARLAAIHFTNYFLHQSGRSVDSQFIQQGTQHVELAMDEYLRAHPDSAAMSTAISLLHFDSQGAHIAWAGDCRVYHVRRGEVCYVTDDHTETNSLQQAAGSAAREHNILRAIQGAKSPTALAYHLIPWGSIAAEDYFMLCSDGIFQGMSEELLHTTFEHSKDAIGITQEIDALNDVVDNADNYSCLVIQLEANEVAAGMPVEVAATAASTPEMTVPLASQARAMSDVARVAPAATGLSGAMKAIGIISVLLIGILCFAFWKIRVQEGPFLTYVKKANEHINHRNFESAIAFSDSALRTAKSPAQIKQAQDLKAQTLELRKSAELAAFDQEAATVLAGNNYPSFLLARQLYADLAARYSEPKYAAKADSISKLMKAINHSDAVKQLLAEAQNLCLGEQGDRAANLLSEAEKMDASLAKNREVLSLRKSCGMNEDSRNLAAKKVEPAAPITAPVTAPTITEAKPSIKTNTSTPPSNARINPATAATNVKGSNLEKGKTYFRNARKSKQPNDYKLAMDYLLKAEVERGIDGEAAYMVSVLYNDGLGIAANKSKSFSFADKSAHLGWHPGEFIYGKKLLQEKTGKDSVAGKQYLERASKAGVSDATTILEQLKAFRNKGM